MEETMNPRDHQEQDPLRGYITTLLKHWWLIGLLALLAALAAGVMSTMMTPTYEAVASVVIAKSKIDVSFESTMTSLAENDMALLRGFYNQDEARRQTFAGLVQSGTIATQVIEELGDVLSPAERSPARLLGVVEARIEQQSDLIKIVARSDEPVKAALIANAWAMAFEKYINEVYSGSLPNSFASVQRETQSRKAEYEIAQQAVIDFTAKDDRSAELERLVEEKELIIRELQSGKQAAIAAIIEEEIAIRRQVISAYLQAIADNRMLGFSKGQEAKREILNQLIDAEINGRLAALKRDRDIRVELFASAIQGELDSRLAVFEQQVQEKVGDLEQAYARKDKLDRLLRDARSLQAQVEQHGSFDSNQLALTLLKTEAFASSVPISTTLQVQISPTDGTYQLADVNMLIQALEEERALVDVEIQEMSESLLAGTGYQYLDELSAASLSISTPYTTSQTVVSSEALSPTTTVSQNLTDFIHQGYAELFDLGEMARSTEQVIGDTALFEEFNKLYPELFVPDEVMQLTESISATTPLREQAQQRSKELLQLDGMETILEFGTESEPLTQKIADLQSEVRRLRSEQETLNGKLQELKRARDLAWETYTILARKEEELSVEIEAGGSEVQFASPAVVPAFPVSPRLMNNVFMAGMVGLTLGIALVLALYYLNPEFDVWKGIRRLPTKLRRSRPVESES